MKTQYLSQRFDFLHEYGRNDGRFLEMMIYETAKSRKNNPAAEEVWVKIKGGYKGISANKLQELSQWQISKVVGRLEEKEVIECCCNKNEYYGDRTKQYKLNEKMFSKDILTMILNLSGKPSQTKNTQQQTTVVKTTLQPQPAPTSKTPKAAQETSIKEIEIKTQKLSKKMDSSLAEVDTIAKTAFSEMFLIAFSVVYTDEEWTEGKLKALRSIVLKVSDNYFIQKGKIVTKQELLILLDWLFFAAKSNSFVGETPERFSPFLILKQITNLLAEARKLYKKDASKNDKFIRKDWSEATNELYKNMKI
jgi:hypothetical protein